MSERRSHMNNLIPLSHELPAHPGQPFRPIEPERMHLRQLFGILLQRAKLGLGVAGVVFILVLAAFAMKTPAYSAMGSVVIDPKHENLARADQQQGGLPPDTSAVDTQVEILRSPVLAETVVRRLKLYNDPEFNPQMAPGFFGLAPARPPVANPDPRLVARVTSTVLAHSWARRAGLTYVVQVGFTSSSPAKAALIANTFMDSYLQRQLDGKLRAVTRANGELGMSLEKMRRDAEVAEARVQEYRNAHGLFSAEGATMAEQEVSTINQQIAIAKADTAEKRARLAAAMVQLRNGQGGADVGAALGSDTIKELRKREAEVSVKLAQLQTDFKPEYPEVKRTQAELTDIRHQIQSEINRILSSLRAEASAAAGREASLLGSRGVAQGGLAANGQAQVGLLALQQRADAAKQIYEAYLNRAKQVAAEGSLQQADASVNSPATIPTSPSSPNMKLGAALAFLAALISAGAAMLMAEFWDKHLRSRLDVERELGVPFAGVLPDFRSIKPKGLRGPAAEPSEYLVSHPFSGFAEAFRNLRAFLMISARGDDAKLIAITSAVPREGKSLTSFCLARTLALSGARVVLVDCDLRQRGVTKLIGPREIGLVEVVQDKIPLAEALVHDAKSNCFVLPATGKSVPHDLFSNPETDEVFRQLSAQFDYVILDAPPILGVADARILAAKADRVLYLVQWNKTPLRAAQSAVDILQECGANVAGALLTKVNVKGQARYGYGDSSDYYGYFKNYYIAAA
ncbi:capsular biosynthesis protein [Phenylobacterium hankyongense]|uniref:non-specific protein-tyrosine kinase n=2 Tax=Phenylobacterium hankyongense TaxID=1813876 RepID=A0A328B020_9CAUL|nr:capsular biosynthesis protein [Phenylobacterium hankyongense]